MNVIRRATNRQSLHTILSGDSANVRPEARFQFPVDEGKPSLRAEDIVYQIARKSVAR